jgi:hypothetical protein
VQRARQTCQLHRLCHGELTLRGASICPQRARTLKSDHETAAVGMEVQRAGVRVGQRRLGDALQLFVEER